MKASELMIGDWVECVDSTHKKKVYAQIDAIEEGQTCILVRLDNCNWFLDISFIKPIPLTSEILEKNGFVEYDYDEESEIPKLIFGRFADNSVFVEIYGDCEHGHLEEYYPKYVHELQHALRLCGIEKTIEL